MAFVNDPTNKVILRFEDYNGKVATSEYFVDAAETDPAAGGPAALAAGAAAISSALLTATEIRIGATNSSPGSPSDGNYSRGSDKVSIWYGALDGSRPLISIGAPNGTALDADHITVKPTAATVTALLTALQTYGKTAEGAALTGLMLRGYRRRFSNRRYQ